MSTKLAFILCLMLVAGFRIIHLFDLPYLIQQLYGVFYIFSTGIIVFTIWKQKKRNASNLKDDNLSKSGENTPTSKRLRAKPSAGGR
ncbi:hypothetical protein [Exiguobacterium sp. H66]|uniref:hypothetical protein n=1 Tax=Exiguobacterium sp. H66 TaxID=2751208 RepID=UPI001BE7AFD8|nr:hypothetical protein [Exiguobacterium sp. H66]